MTLEYAPHPTFNCGHDAKLFDFLLADEQTHDGRSSDGAGMVEFQVKQLQAALDTNGLELDKTTREDLQADIAWAKGEGRYYVTYDCF